MYYEIVIWSNLDFLNNFDISNTLTLGHKILNENKIF